MALSNLGFEDDDPAFTGVPENWTLALVATAAEGAGYADGSPGIDGLDPTEDFGGGWSTNEDYVFAYADPQDPLELLSAIYDGALPKPESIEDFEEGWSINQAYSFTMGSVAQASFDGNVVATGTVAEPYTALVGGEDQRMTTDQGGIALSDPVAAGRAENLGSGGSFVWAALEGSQRVRVTVDALVPSVDTQLQGVTLLTVARNLFNANFQTAHSVDCCEIIASDLRFFGQLLGTNGLIGLENLDGGIVVSGNSEQYDLSDGLTLFVKVDGAGSQTITFLTADFDNIALAKAQEVIDVLNRDLVGNVVAVFNGAGPSFFVGIQTTSTGQANPSSIQVTGGTANSGGGNRLNFPTSIRESPVQRMGLVPSNVAGSGNVGNITSVLAAELAAIVNGSAAIQAIGGAAQAVFVPGLGITLEILTLTTNGTGFIKPEDSDVGTEVGLSLAQIGPTGVVGELLEDFEEGWSTNQSYSFTMGSTTAALYDSGTPEDVEDFEEEWDSNESYSFTMGGTTAATYDTGPAGTPEDVEDFEEVLEPFAVTADPVTDELLKTTHGLSNTQVVQLSNTNGTLPGGLSPNTDYFVVSATASTFKLSATSGGAAIDITDAGTGTHIVKPDRSVFWTLAMVTL